MVQYRVDDSGRPNEAVYAQHSGWRAVRLRRQVRTERRTPYSSIPHTARTPPTCTRAPATALWPDPNDEADGQRPLSPTPASSRSPRRAPRWMTYPGPLGPRRTRARTSRARKSPLRGPRLPAPGPLGQTRPHRGQSPRELPGRLNQVGKCDAPEKALTVAVAACRFRRCWWSLRSAAGGADK